MHISAVTPGVLSPAHLASCSWVPVGGLLCAPLPSSSNSRKAASKSAIICSVSVSIEVLSPASGTPAGATWDREKRLVPLVKDGMASTTSSTDLWAFLRFSGKAIQAFLSLLK
jgi:hypothetical protein